MKKASESGFLKAVLQYAKLRGWRTAHFRPARTDKGWRTAVQGDGAGFPDLVLVRGDRVIFAELKMPRGKPTMQQVQWIASLLEAKAEVYVWTPNSWPDIEVRLR